MEQSKQPSAAAQLAAELQRNRELTRVLYTLRGEAPPNDHGDEHSMAGEPVPGERPRPWEVYSGLPGIDALYSGASKRTPTGGYFTS